MKKWQITLTAVFGSLLILSQSDLLCVRSFFETT